MQFLPWLMELSISHLRRARVARAILDELVRVAQTERLGDMKWLDTQLELAIVSRDEAANASNEPPYPYFFTDADWVGIYGRIN
jgi:hypothetical protein